MRERFWLLVELLLRKFNVGKEPAEAHNFTRGEQLWFRTCVWVGRQEWLPLSVQMVAQLQSAAMAAMTWSRPHPAWAATAGETEKLLLVLGTLGEVAERFGMRPATLEDFGKGKEPQPYSPRLYEEPIHMPPQTWWERILTGIINIAVRWMCRK